MSRAYPLHIVVMSRYFECFQSNITTEISWVRLACLAYLYYEVWWYLQASIALKPISLLRDREIHMHISSVFNTRYDDISNPGVLWTICFRREIVSEICVSRMYLSHVVAIPRGFNCIQVHTPTQKLWDTSVHLKCFQYSLWWYLKTSSAFNRRPSRKRHEIPMHISQVPITQERTTLCVGVHSGEWYRGDTNNSVVCSVNKLTR